MIPWTECRMGNVVNLQQGLCINNKSNHLLDTTGYPLLRITDLINRQEQQYINKDKVSKKFLTQKGELIYTRTGQVGLIFNDRVGVLHNNCFKIIPNKEIDKDFLFWFLRTQSAYDYANGVAAGAAQPDLGHTAFKSMPLKYPSLPIQKKIAAVLTTYDDLVEINNRRIQILEKMAEEIYREWFIRMRFPGYQKTDFIKGIPENWIMGSVGLLYGVKSGFAFKSTDLGETGHRIIKIKNINEDGIDTNSCERYSGSLNDRILKFELETGDLLIAMTGATIGKNGIFIKENERFFLNQRVGKFFRKKKNLSTQIFMYLTAQTENFQGQLLNYALGAAQSNISGEQIEKIKILVPEEKILIEFSKLCEPAYDFIVKLKKLNNLLNMQKGLLLPRLISGKLSVENLDIKFAPSMEEVNA